MILILLLACSSQDIATHPSGQAVYIPDEACVVNDVDSGDEFARMLAWCWDQKD